MKEQAGWTVEFYVDARGNSPVTAFMDGLPEQEQAKMARAIALLREFGTLLGMPHARHIERGLWELRAGAGRIFYFAHTGRRFILLHAYLKQRQVAPRQEVATARRRGTEFLEGER